MKLHDNNIKVYIGIVVATIILVLMAFMQNASGHIELHMDIPLEYYEALNEKFDTFNKPSEKQKFNQEYEGWKKDWEEEALKDYNRDHENDYNPWN